VTNVRWTLGDEYLISVGGNDRCVFQWKHEMMKSDIVESDLSNESNELESKIEETIEVSERGEGK
jgi:hypothetical protein